MVLKLTVLPFALLLLAKACSLQDRYAVTLVILATVPVGQVCTPC